MELTVNLEKLASSVLDNIDSKPNYSLRDFFNATIIFQSALMDKMYDNQDYDGMKLEDREKMAVRAGNELRKLIFTYTNLDTTKLEDFL